MNGAFGIFPGSGGHACRKGLPLLVPSRGSLLMTGQRAKRVRMMQEKVVLKIAQNQVIKDLLGELKDALIEHACCCGSGEGNVGLPCSVTST